MDADTIVAIVAVVIAGLALVASGAAVIYTRRQAAAAQLAARVEAGALLAVTAGGLTAGPDGGNLVWAGPIGPLRPFGAARVGERRVPSLSGSPTGFCRFDTRPRHTAIS